jgi:uncharacterized protein (TIGR02466 family)
MPLFPTPVLIKRIDFPGATLIPHLEALDYHAVHKSAGRTVYSESSYEMALFSRPEFAELGRVVVAAVNAFAREVLEVTTEMRVTTSWATRCAEAAESRRHRHCNAYLSAVFYPEVQGPVGALRLERDPPSDFLVKPVRENQFTTTSCVLPPVSNLLVIFPARLFHAVDPNPGSAPRYSIASNYAPVGTFGEGDSTMTIR